MAAPYEFDSTSFRLAFPAYANTTTYPDATLQMYWDTATSSLIDNTDYGVLTGTARERAINLMVAHLVALSVIIASGVDQGGMPGLVQSSTIDKVSVTLTPPPVKTQFQWWLSLTPYGQQLLAILQIATAGGYYIGGLPELCAFRKVGGVF